MATELHESTTSAISILLIAICRNDKLQDKETEIIIEQIELSKRIESVEENILDLKESITSKMDKFILPTYTLFYK